MAAQNEKLVASLRLLKSLQKGGHRVFQSKELTRIHRERLLQHGFVREVMKGWLISSEPSVNDADTTAWYASFWEFCAKYCRERFGDDWRLSPEQSLLLQAENTTVPSQVIVYSPKGTNNTLNLPFQTSLFDLKQKDISPESDMATFNGLRLFSSVAAVVRISDNFFTRYPVEAQVVLAGMRDPSDVLRHLIEGGRSVVAGRLAGAFRRIGRGDLADDILSTMRAAGHDVRETDPFSPQQTLGRMPQPTAPIVGRLQAFWHSMRGLVVEIFPNSPGLPQSKEAYLRSVDEIYKSDAYHSLSIEGYQVTPELIERVRSGTWDPDNHDADRRSRDALAARGYWQAFQLVKQVVAKVIAGENPGALVRTAHREWYRELFQPCAAAGLIPAAALAGYRNDAVYIRASRHVPPRWEAVRDAMPAFFDLLQSETDPGVRAVLGHWLFGYIHPYQDGNGRMARFLMNVLLAAGGYPWTVIRVDDRTSYLSALESASVENDIRPFATFIAERVR